ncbi:MAG: uroporphyrinogen-III synthase [Pirellulaceae bacterium]|nr:uroporphyrinogen-III synthase [Pirellulaceae bacterium]
MTREPHPSPGNIQRLPWPPNAAGVASVATGSSLTAADLVVAGPNVPATATASALETTPIVCLPHATGSEPPEAADRVHRLADEAASRGSHVVWIESAEPSNEPTAAETLSRAGLRGRWVLVTRPRRQAADVVERLRSLGATVVSRPAIAIRPPDDWAAVDAAIARLEEYDWIVFSSVNGARFLLDRLEEQSSGLDRLGKTRLAAIGPGTADALAQRGLRADLIPAAYRAESLAEALVVEAAGKHFLLARASRGREVLADRLSAVGARVDQVVVYRSEDIDADDSRLRPVVELIDEGRIDWITVTSSAIARSLARLFGSRLGKTRLASISPITSRVLGDLGYRPAVEARDYTMEGVVEAMLAANEKP